VIKGYGKNSLPIFVVMDFMINILMPVIDGLPQLLLK
jgi:hypothetical protein